MSRILENKAIVSVFLSGTVILAFILPFLSLTPVFTLLVVLLYYLFLIMFFYPRIALFAMILIRPCFDILSNDSLATIAGVNINFASLLGMMTVALGLFIAYTHRKKIKTLPLKKSFSAFLAITLISVFLSYDPFASAVEWFRLLSIFSLFSMSYVLVSSKEDFVLFLRIVILSSIVPSVFAIYQYYTGTGLSIPFEGIYNRIYGTFAHPNLFAYYLIIPIALSVLLFLRGDKKKLINIVFSVLLVFLTVVLTLTYTRGAWLSFIIVLGLIGIIRYRRLLLVAVIAAVLSYMMIDPINSRVNDLLFNKYSSVYWRISLWQDSIAYAQEKIILGHGTGTAKDLIMDKRGVQFGSSDPHNDYLKITLENGLVGLISYLILAISLTYALIKKYKQTSQPTIKTIILVILGIALSFYIMGFADNILRNTALQWTFWAIVGAIFSVLAEEKKRHHIA